MQAIFGAAWLLVVSAGLVTLLVYEHQPGAASAEPAGWPSESQLPRAVGVPTLVLLAHPHCPCTRATLEELNQLLARSPVDLRVHALFFAPSDEAPEWAHTDLWRTVEALPGVEVRVDRDAREATLFGAETSGHVVLFNASGELLFRGGITGSRGHAGDNLGRQSILAHLSGQGSAVRNTPTFGCSLTEREGP